ncbi:MAG: hypothetical protein JW732_08015 [Dehalococcoidia bacterium]|nr:hypothetical protein [Dehalococcoidia bacterium]
MKRGWGIILSLLIALLVTSSSCEANSGQESVEVAEIAIYSGKGAVLFEDVAYALELLDIKYSTLDENDIKERKLEHFKFLIVPGGYTQEYMPALGEAGREAIRNFVRAGGSYIGICGGAYLAAERVEVPGRPEGLGIIDIESIRKSGMGMVKIYLTNHPVTKGLASELVIYYQNGPEIVAGENVEGIARYGNGSFAIVASSFGKGKVICFSPHPEGSISQGIRPEPETLKLLSNALEWRKGPEALML